MDTGKYIILLFIGCMLISCTKEITTIIPAPGEEEVNNKTSLRIVFDQSSDTRSSWVYDGYFPPATPTEEESKVNNVLLVIFKNIFLDEFWLYKGTRIKPHPTESNTIVLLNEEGEEDELDLDSGIHFFYSIINIPEGLYEEIEPKLENGLLNGLTIEEFEKQMMEVNLEYLKGKTEGQQDGTGFIMTNRNPPEQSVIRKDRENKISIPVGRALAKVSLAYIPAKTGELHGSLENIEYKTVNHPSQMYLMPVMENGTLLTPHYNNTVTTGFLHPAKDAKDDNRPWLKATTVTTSGNFAFDYCIENNVKTHKKSNSTGLLIRGKFIPKVWLNKDGSVGEEKEDGDGTFWRIIQYDKDGYLLTYTKGYYNEQPEQLPGTDFRAVSYPEGICYYTFWLTTGEEHLVKRNSFHKVVITHIHGAGAPDPGDLVEPDVDPDPIPTWGRLAVFAMGWDDYPLIQIIGEESNGNSDNEGSVTVPDWNKNPQDEEKLEEGDNNKFK